MTPIQRIIRYPMLLKEICTNFEKAEQAANAANSSLSKAEIYKRNIFIEAYNSSQVLAEYTDQMLIASRITGYAVSTYIERLKLTNWKDFWKYQIFISWYHVSNHLKMLSG